MPKFVESSPSQAFLLASDMREWVPDDDLARFVLEAVGAEDRRRRHDFRPPAPEKPAVEPKAEWLVRMGEKMKREDSRAHYRLRKQTVEPVFGIVKEAMGFRRFLLRGMEKVEGEWALVTLAYNCKRLNNMMRA